MISGNAQPDQIFDYPLVSIVIPVLNEEFYIEKTLFQLSEQTYPSTLMEIIVVDGGSSDLTCKIVADNISRLNLNIKIISNNKKVSSSARNLGVGISTGEYILFIDAHVFIPSVRLVESMVSAAIRRDAMVLGRAQPLAAPFLNDFQSVVAGVRGSILGHSTKSFIFSDYEGWVSPVSVGVMYHHSIFDEAMIFDEQFDAAEDVEFNYRLEQKGYKAYISPDFKILYYPRKNIVSLARQMFRYGVGRAKFTAKHQGGLDLEIFVPISVMVIAIFLFFLVLNKVTSIFFIVLSVFFYISIFVFLGNNFSRFFQKVMAPPCLFVIHIGLASGLLVGFLRAFFKRSRV